MTQLKARVLTTVLSKVMSIMINCLKLKIKLENKLDGLTLPVSIREHDNLIILNRFR